MWSLRRLSYRNQKWNHKYYGFSWTQSNWPDGEELSIFVENPYSGANTVGWGSNCNNAYYSAKPGPRYHFWHRQKLSFLTQEISGGYGVALVIDNH